MRKEKAYFTVIVEYEIFSFSHKVSTVNISHNSRRSAEELSTPSSLARIRREGSIMGLKMGKVDGIGIDCGFGSRLRDQVKSV